VTRLELSDDEARELKLALETQVHRLRVELINADARDFKAGLREELTRLERVTERLATSMAAGGDDAEAVVP
jgi:hypothetical protein